MENMDGSVCTIKVDVPLFMSENQVRKPLFSIRTTFTVTTRLLTRSIKQYYKHNATDNDKTNENNFNENALIWTMGLHSKYF